MMSGAGSDNWHELKGGKARADKLSIEERSEIVRKAAKACWAKRSEQKK